MGLSLSRRHVVDALLDDVESRRFFVLVGPRGSGKSTLLEQLAVRTSRRVALAQLDPIAATPAMLDSELRRLAQPLLPEPDASSTSPFTSLLDALAHRPEDSLLLLDDVTEIRTLSHYPDVDAPLPSFLRALEATGRAVGTSRFSFWLRREHPEVELRVVPPVSARELDELGVREPERLAAATAGLTHHAVRVADTMLELGLDVEGALARELAPGGRVEAECRATLAELLLRARGYAACKAILRILADEEGLKLTEVARRMDRTAGSTRDYLRWLEEVDLIHAVRKRFFYVDPLVRLWSRIYRRGTPQTNEHLRYEISRYLSSITPNAIEPLEDSGFTLPPPPSSDLVEID